ncbi:defective in cullin neddylation protein AAR3-like isoform X2 [Impatiens glandulifera]|uniref:defective in cullin neddylation protein AAR3-like isoform X2 n=1 Tax=Impatiens glandulifera TaxID=253017 RepID=UPI001FB04EAF|nr:defective in cullin neddylation protein AAR3-like isoform X2 [Impatiens glandulifera]
MGLRLFFESMDTSDFNQFDIFDIYRRYCEITSGASSCISGKLNSADEQEHNPRKQLDHLLKLVQSKIHARDSIFDEIYRLNSTLVDLEADFSEFARFYDFVFYICRENGQKNITVNKAVRCWRMVLVGRFRLLNQWCDFVEGHNISEDTWTQVLAFSRCVHEDLEGYDPQGAWPLLIDEFAEYMYRITGSISTWSINQDALPGELRCFPGSKRKKRIGEDPSFHIDTPTAKRRHSWVIGQAENRPGITDCTDLVEQNVAFGNLDSLAGLLKIKNPSSIW